MTPSEINTEIIKLGIITGIVFYIINAILRHFLRKRALDNIKRNLQEGEFIVYEPKFAFSIEHFAPFMLGMTIAGEMPYMPFAKSLISQEFLVFLVVDLFFVFILLFISSTKFVLTNKRITYSCAFKFLYSISKYVFPFKHLNYSNIKSFENKRTIQTWIKVFYIYTNDNESFHLNYFNNKKAFQAVIEKYKNEKQ